MDMGFGLTRQTAGVAMTTKAGSIETITHGYILSTLFVVSALLLTLALGPLFPYPFFLLFFPAVMGATWYGGSGPGLLSVALSTLLVDYFLVPPIHSLAIKPTDTAYFMAFVACSVAASWVSAIKKKHQQDLLTARDQLTVHVEQRTAELERSHSVLHEQERQFQLLTEILPDQIMGISSSAAGLSSAAGSLEGLLGAVLEFAVTMVPCDACALYVREKDELVLRASKNRYAGAVDRLKLDHCKGIAGWGAESIQPVTIADNASDDQRFRLFNQVLSEHSASFLSVPLLSHGHLVGAINLQSRGPRSFSQREIRLMSTIGILIGAEVEMARLEIEVNRLSDKLEARKVVERAKGIVQRELRLSEEEAYLTLQRESRQRGKSMRDVSEAIVLNDEIRHRSKS